MLGRKRVNPPSPEELARRHRELGDRIDEPNKISRAKSSRSHAGGLSLWLIPIIAFGVLERCFG